MEVWASAPLPERLQDHHHHALGICENFVVPESQHLPALPLEPGGPALVSLVLIVLSTVGFDDQTIFDASEVHDERTERMLPAKLVGRQTSAAQARPEPALGIGHRDAQGSCSWARHGGQV